MWAQTARAARQEKSPPALTRRSIPLEGVAPVCAGAGPMRRAVDHLAGWDPHALRTVGQAGRCVVGRGAEAYRHSHPGAQPWATMATAWLVKMAAEGANALVSDGCTRG